MKLGLSYNKLFQLHSYAGVRGVFQSSLDALQALQDVFMWSISECREELTRIASERRCKPAQSIFSCISTARPYSTNV
jgi:hypothetical protein